MKTNQLAKVRQALLYPALPILFFACSKGGSTTPPQGNNCNVTINVTAATTNSDPCASTGSITITATGSTGFTYSIDGGNFQASNVFNNVSKGNHTLSVKDKNGCTGAGNTSVAEATIGAQFAAVKALVATHCAVPGCHNGTQAPNYTVDCNIVSFANTIKTRAVDQAGTANQMPQPPNAALSQADQDKITAWVAGGGKYTN